ncbi:quinone oxidoreductase family protein [Streptomyces sp. MB09-02B]|uniref:quinone oxidoreductase family protein n=1 Tax=Streptomyces sp. MB09-02B TaxID=3028667 RepID=UPI0039AF2460
MQINKFGGPEVLQAAEVSEPLVGSGQTLVEVSSAGVNYADTHLVENSYMTNPRLPLVPGTEVVGRTPDGQRVVALPYEGGYAERVAAPIERTFPLPDGLGDQDALAMCVQGVTAWHLLRVSARLAKGESVVVQAAAGGTGSFAVQLAREFGAGRVIAVASTREKRDLAMSLGADAAIDGSPQGLSQRLLDANKGRPVDVILEMTGGRSFDSFLASLAPFGRLAVYGIASRLPPRPVQPAQLMSSSRAVVGFWLQHCLEQPEMYGRALSELFELVGDGRVKPVRGKTYSLRDARRAHEDLRSRGSVGKLVLDTRR